MNQPIQSLEAEMCLLGSMLIDSQAIFKIIDLIEDRDFYNPKHSQIFRTYREMFISGEDIDIQTLSEKLRNKKELENIGGASYLVHLTSTIPTAYNILSYAKIVKEKSLRRQILTAQQYNEQDTYNENIEIEKVLAGVQDRLYKISPIKTKKDDVISIMSDLEEIQKNYAEKYKNGKKTIGYSSGFDKIDEVVDGLQAGHFWVIGAWHGTGKTSFALNIIHSILEQNIPVSIISNEMSQTQITAKLMGIRNELSSMKILKGINDKDVSDRITEAKQFLGQTNLEVHIEFEIEKIKMLIRKDVYTRGVKVVLIDYLQKISSDKIFDETTLVSQTSKELSNLAQELKITIILLSQISNDAQKGLGAGAGFKGSGTIEASADFALVLKRDKTKETPMEKWVEMKVQITKNKFGIDGIIPMYFHLKSGQVKKDLF